MNWCAVFFLMFFPETNQLHYLGQTIDWTGKVNVRRTNFEEKELMKKTNKIKCVMRNEGKKQDTILPFKDIEKKKDIVFSTDCDSSKSCNYKSDGIWSFWQIAFWIKRTVIFFLQLCCSEFCFFLLIIPQLQSLNVFLSLFKLYFCIIKEIRLSFF